MGTKAPKSGSTEKPARPKRLIVVAVIAPPPPNLRSAQKLLGKLETDGPHPRPDAQPLAARRSLQNLHLIRLDLDPNLRRLRGNRLEPLGFDVLHGVFQYHPKYTRVKCDCWEVRMGTRGKAKLKRAEVLPLRQVDGRALARWATARRTSLGATTAGLARRARVSKRDIELFERAGEVTGTVESRALARAYGVPFLLLEVWLGFVTSADLRQWERWRSQA